MKRKKPDVPPTNDEAVASTTEKMRRLSETPGSAIARDEDREADINEAVHDNSEAPRAPAIKASPANDIQILELHSHNPIISYQNHIYHCTWSDLVGTAMFFSKVEVGDGEDALLSTDDFRLINTSRIKLIGQKAKLIAKSGRKGRREAEEESSDVLSAGVEAYEADSVGKGKSLGGIRTTNPKQNADIKRQAAFLENLMDVKRAKGESDNVRTVFSQRRPNTRIMQPGGSVAKRSRESQEYPSITAEIEELNRKVVRGDAAALMRLQDIYSSMQDDAPDRSSRPRTPLVAGKTPDASLRA